MEVVTLNYNLGGEFQLTQLVKFLMLIYNILNINLIKVGQLDVNWEKVFFPFKFGVKCHFHKFQGRGT